MSEYNFIITARELDVSSRYVAEKIENNVEVFNFRICVEVLKSSVSFCEIHIVLDSYNPKEQKIIVQDMYFDSGDRKIECIEFIGYMTGYFEFTSRDDIRKAMTDLALTLNNNQANFEDLESKWNTFARQFTSWFNEKLRPCLDKELEMNKMYFEQL